MASIIDEVKITTTSMAPRIDPRMKPGRFSLCMEDDVEFSMGDVVGLVDPGWKERFDSFFFDRERQTLECSDVLINRNTDAFLKRAWIIKPTDLYLYAAHCAAHSQ